MGRICMATKISYWVLVASLGVALVGCSELETTDSAKTPETAPVAKEAGTDAVPKTASADPANPTPPTAAAAAADALAPPPAEAKTEEPAKPEAVAKAEESASAPAPTAKTEQGAAQPVVAQVQEPAPSKASSSVPSTYTVQTGDTLMKVAFENYGDLFKWRSIYDANRDKVKDPNHVPPGTVLTLDTSAMPVTVAHNGEHYLIKGGDTLGTISDDVYGSKSKWKKIWENNKELIHDPNRIFAGFTLYYTFTDQDRTEYEQLKGQSKPAPLAKTTGDDQSSPRAPASADEAGSQSAPAN